MKAAWNRLVRRPLYALSVIAVLSAGLGGALCLYGAVDGVLFRPLEVGDADRLVRVFRVNETGSLRDNWSRPYVADVLGGNEAFSDVAWYVDWLQLTRREAGSEQILNGALVSGNFFDVLRVAPRAGRFIQARDAVRGSAPVAVLGHALWRNRFNASEAVIGDVIELNGRSFTVVGIAPPGFSGVKLERRIDVWLPASAADIAMSGFTLEMLLDSPGMSWIDAVARLAPGVSVKQAQTMLDTQRLARGGSEIELEAAEVVPARKVAIDEEGERGARRLSWLLLGLVGVLLLVVSADVVGLMLVRAESQRGETAVRMSLGAGKRRISLEVLTESVLLTACAGVFAIMIAWLLARWLLAVAGDDLGLAASAETLLFNPRVLPVFAGMLALTVVLTSVAPMRRLVGVPLAEALRGARTGGAERGIGVRDGMVALQLGLSLVLLAAAVTFIGSLRETLAIDPGFATENRAVTRITLNRGAEERAQYVTLLDALRADGRVQDAALALFAPVNSSGMRRSVDPQGYAAQPDEDMQVNLLPISDGFFATLGIELLAGRDVNMRVPEERVGVVVNQAFVDRYWPDRPPVGALLYDFEGNGRAAEVVGVVANHQQRALRGDPLPIVFVPSATMFVSSMDVVVEAGSAEQGLAAIRETVNRLLPEAGILGASSLQGRLQRLTARDRAITTLAISSAVFATLLAVVGMYGVAAFAIRHRQREIGIRYSLGATRFDVVMRFLRHGVLIAAAGIVGGGGLTLLLDRSLAGTIGGVDGVSLLALAGVTLLLAVVALLANLVPVWRAAEIEPMSVLRDE